LALQHEQRQKQIVTFTFISLMIIATILFLILQSLKIHQASVSITRENKRTSAHRDALTIAVTAKAPISIEMPSPIATAEEVKTDTTPTIYTKTDITISKSTITRKPNKVKSNPIAQNKQIILSGNSWIFIENREGVVFSGLAKTGDKISLTGNPPFMIKVGLPENVFLHENGSKLLTIKQKKKAFME
jgi:hypothetical protein